MVLKHHTKNQLKQSSCSRDISIWKFEQSDCPHRSSPSMHMGIMGMNTAFIDFLLRFYNIIQKISSNSLAVLEIFNSEKSSYLIGPNLPCQDKPRGTIVIKTTFAVFLLWFYNIIQKMKSKRSRRSLDIQIWKMEQYQSCQGKPRGTTCHQEHIHWLPPMDV